MATVLRSSGRTSHVINRLFLEKEKGGLESPAYAPYKTKEDLGTHKYLHLHLHPIPSRPGISHIEFITRQRQGCRIIQEARISSRPRRSWIPAAGERTAEDGHPDVPSVPATCQWNTWSVPLSSWTAGKQTARDGHGQQRLYKVLVFKIATPIDWTPPDKNSDAMYDTVCGWAVDPGK